MTHSYDTRKQGSIRVMLHPAPFTLNALAQQPYLTDRADISERAYRRLTLDRCTRSGARRSRWFAGHQG